MPALLWEADVFLIKYWSPLWGGRPKSFVTPPCIPSILDGPSRVTLNQIAILLQTLPSPPYFLSPDIEKPVQRPLFHLYFHPVIFGNQNINYLGHGIFKLMSAWRYLTSRIRYLSFSSHRYYGNMFINNIILSRKSISRDVYSVHTLK